MKDGVPGMKFTVDGSDGWTPVRKRRCRPKSKMRASSDSEGSSSDVDVSCSRLVEYSVRDGTCSWFDSLPQECNMDSC